LKDTAIILFVTHIPGGKVKHQRTTPPLPREKLKAVQTLFREIRNQVGAILERSPEMFQVSGASEKILATSGQLLEQIENLSTAYQATFKTRLAPYIVTLAGLVSLGLIILLALIYLRDSKRQLNPQTSDLIILDIEGAVGPHAWGNLVQDSIQFSKILFAYKTRIAIVREFFPNAELGLWNTLKSFTSTDTTNSTFLALCRAFKLASVDSLFNMVDFLIPNYVNEGKSYLTIRK